MAVVYSLVWKELIHDYLTAVLSDQRIRPLWMHGNPKALQRQNDRKQERDRRQSIMVFNLRVPCRPEQMDRLNSFVSSHIWDANSACQDGFWQTITTFAPRPLNGFYRRHRPVVHRTDRGNGLNLHAVCVLYIYIYSRALSSWPALLQPTVTATRGIFSS